MNNDMQLSICPKGKCKEQVESGKICVTLLTKEPQVQIPSASSSLEQTSANTSTWYCCSSKIFRFDSYLCMNLCKITSKYSLRPRFEYIHFRQIWQILVEAKRSESALTIRVFHHLWFKVKWRLSIGTFLIFFLAFLYTSIFSPYHLNALPPKYFLWLRDCCSNNCPLFSFQLLCSCKGLS